MAIRDNPYLGINAHFQSRMQTTPRREYSDDWVSFHASHIAHIADALNESLPDQYFARAEKSLQIRLDDPSQPTLSPRPDVTVWQRSIAGQPLVAEGIAQPTAIISTIEETLQDIPEKQPKAVVIYAEEMPITRIELLSTANKPPHGSVYLQYIAARDLAVYSGQALIELDYLHESRSPLAGLPIYPTDENTHPYRMIISNPRQAKDQVLIYGISVDEPLPIVGIPLLDIQQLPFDFGTVYSDTFRKGRWGYHLDYGQLPDRFETYSKTDQARIQHRMATLAL